MTRQDDYDDYGDYDDYDDYDDDDDDDDDDDNDADNEDDVLFQPTQTNPTNEGKEHCDTGHGTLTDASTFKRTKTFRRKQADEEYILITTVS